MFPLSPCVRCAYCAHILNKQLEKIEDILKFEKFILVYDIQKPRAINPKSKKSADRKLSSHNVIQQLIIFPILSGSKGDTGTQHTK